MSKSWGKWLYEVCDCEMWRAEEEYDTKEEAIKRGREVAVANGCGRFFVGRIMPEDPVSPDADWIIEQAQDYLFDNVGEVAENWDPTREQSKDLQRRLETMWREWLEENDLTGKIFGVEDVSTHKTAVGEATR